MLTTWVVAPIRLPLVRRRCPACAAPAGQFRADGKFRVNANHKLLDAWLLVLCTSCGETAKLTVLERTRVCTIRPALLDRLHANDPTLAAELLQDPTLQRRNHITLDWEGAWHLDTGDPDVPDGLDVPGGLGGAGGLGGLGGLDREVIDVSVHFEARIPIRPVRLIADGCALPRAEVERLLADGKLVSATRLSGKVSGDFTFTLKR